MSRCINEPERIRYFVSENELIKLDTGLDLPYMKCVELTEHTPQQFGLDKWLPKFRIPDHWMKKIYRNEVYKDTDLPEPESEVISEQQKSYLRNYLLNSDHYGCPYEAENRSFRLRNRIVPADDLKKHLSGDLTSDDDDDDDDGDGNKDVLTIQIDSDSNEQVVERTPCDKTSKRSSASPSPSEHKNDRIPILRHKVQPEEVVVEMALEKMKHLDPDDEKRYKDLLKDEEFMKLLSRHVQRHVEPYPT